MLGVVIHAPKDLRRDKVKPVVEKYAGDIGEDLMSLTRADIAKVK